MELFTVVIFAVVVLVAVIVAFLVGRRVGLVIAHKHWETQLPVHRRDAINRSRAVLGGHFSEQLAPFLPDYPYKPTETKFLGRPVDLVVFKGLDEKNIEEVVFVEVKSGKSSLSASERSLKEAVDKKRVRFEEYRVPESLVEKKGDYAEGTAV